MVLVGGAGGPAAMLVTLMMLTMLMMLVMLGDDKHQTKETGNEEWMPAQVKAPLLAQNNQSPQDATASRCKFCNQALSTTSPPPLGCSTQGFEKQLISSHKGTSLS